MGGWKHVTLVRSRCVEREDTFSYFVFQTLTPLLLLLFFSAFAFHSSAGVLFPFPTFPTCRSITQRPAFKAIVKNTLCPITHPKLIQI
jgi:hypothetical protein